MKQKTFRNKLYINGIGLHSGEKVSITLNPAAENTGIVFNRTDVANGKNPLIQATYDRVSDTKLCTKITNNDGVSVATIEHLMAALCAFGIDNTIIDIDAAEVPILDGSSDPFMFLFESVGAVEQRANKKIIKILKPVTMEENHWSVTLEPANSMIIDCTIKFPNTIIGQQRYVLELTKENFEKEISKARTFVQLSEVDALRKIGLALGGNNDNSIVIDQMNLVTTTPLRFEDEFVRHKILDIIGDLYLSTGYIQAKITSNCSGHTGNNKILRKLFSMKDCYEIIDLNNKFSFQLPKQYYKSKSVNA